MTSSNYVGEAQFYIIPTIEDARQYIPDFQEAPESAPWLAVKLSTGLVVFGRATVIEILYAWAQADEARKAVQP